MPYDRLCLNDACSKPFRTYDSRAKYCSHHCHAVMRVYVPTPLAPRFWAKVCQCMHGDFCPFCCWNWTASLNPAGYGYFGVKEGGDWITRLAHTVAWELVNGQPVPHGLQINHHCDNPPCCNPWHIYPGTRLQNALDAQQRGRLAVGEARSSLTIPDVVLMREWYRQGASLLDLVARFHKSPSAIFNILSGSTWKHVPGSLSREELRTLANVHKGKPRGSYKKRIK